MLAKVLRMGWPDYPPPRPRTSSGTLVNIAMLVLIAVPSVITIIAFVWNLTYDVARLKSDMTDLRQAVRAVAADIKTIKHEQ